MNLKKRKTLISKEDLRENKKLRRPKKYVKKGKVFSNNLKIFTVIHYDKLLKYKEKILADIFVVNKKLLFDEILNFLKLKKNNVQCIEGVLNFIGSLQSFREKSFCYLGIFETENVNLDSIVPFEIPYDNYQRIVFLFKNENNNYQFVDYRSQSEYVHVCSTDDLKKEEEEKIEEKINIMINYIKKIDILLFNFEPKTLENKIIFTSLKYKKEKNNMMNREEIFLKYRKNVEIVHFCIYIQFTTEKKVTTDFFEKYSEYLIRLHENMLYGIIPATLLKIEFLEQSK